MSYPNVHIVNSTAYNAAGSVSYASLFCSNDSYNANAGHDWTASSRGVCLVTEITATLVVNGSPVNAAPYTSSGTSYSQFAIIQSSVSPLAFAVTRITDLGDAAEPEQLPEPTENQK